jgi:predicted nucleic acid-binding protein
MQVPVPVIVIALIAVVALLAVVGWLAGERRRSTQLKERFGPEYDRTVASTGERKEAETELERRRRRVDQLRIRPLDDNERDRFTAMWRVVQTRFVDEPAEAVHDADLLIGKVMAARGYPVADFEQRAADVSVNHPQVVDHYRIAHGIAERGGGTTADTEDLRQAMVHYRALFSDLLETGDDTSETSRQTEPAGASGRQP